MSQNCFFTVWIIFYHVSFFCFFLSVYIHTISLSILSITLATFVSWIKIYYSNSTDNYWPSSTVLRPPNDSVFWVKTKISSQDCHVLKVYERVECQELTGRRLSIVFFFFSPSCFLWTETFQGPSLRFMLMIEHIRSGPLRSTALWFFTPLPSACMLKHEVK